MRKLTCEYDQMRRCSLTLKFRGWKWYFVVAILWSYHCCWIVWRWNAFYSGGEAPSQKMGLVCFVLFLSCRFCTLDADWFLAPCLSAHHMLGQWTGISVDERFATLIWRINAYAYAFAIFLPCGVHQFSLVCLYFIDNFTSKNFWFQHAFVVSSV